MKITITWLFWWRISLYYFIMNIKKSIVSQGSMKNIFYLVLLFNTLMYNINIRFGIGVWVLFGPKLNKPIPW